MDKRKSASSEMEGYIREKYKSAPMAVPVILRYIRTQIIENPGSKLKKAGLHAFGSLSAVVMAHHREDIKIILLATITAMNDDDVKIRFSACETMFNILNTCRTDLIEDICLIFDHLIKVPSCLDYRSSQPIPAKTSKKPPTP